MGVKKAGVGEGAPSHYTGLIRREAAEMEMAGWLGRFLGLTVGKI